MKKSYLAAAFQRTATEFPEQEEILKKRGKEGNRH